MVLQMLLNQVKPRQHYVIQNLSQYLLVTKIIYNENEDTNNTKAGTIKLSSFYAER